MSRAFLFSRLLPSAVVLLGLLATAPAGAQGLSLLRDEETEQTLRTFARPIFEEAGLSASSVRFIIVRSDDLNAFVAGGQNIFVNTGLILQTKNPDELIGVLAHESGHIAGGHLFRTQEVIDDLSLQAMLANIIGIAAAAGARSGEAGMAIGSAGNTITMRQMLRHSRVQETSADQAGVRFLEGAQLPVGGFLSFMEKLSSQELLPESQQSEYVRTHPLTRDRIDFLENEVNKAKSKDKGQGQLPAGWTELHARIKAKLLGYLWPDRALQDRGDSVASRYGRAVANWRKARNTEAIAILDTLIAEQPKDPYFQEQKAQIQFEMGRIDDAAATYRTAVSLAPNSGLMRIAYARALLESKKDIKANNAEAVRQLQLSMGPEPRQAETHRLLAIAYGRNGDEGMSRLHMAEESLLRGKTDFAKKEADLARQKLAKGSPAWLRSQDILEAVRQRKKTEKKK